MGAVDGVVQVITGGGDVEGVGTEGRSQGFSLAQANLHSGLANGCASLLLYGAIPQYAPV